VSISIPRKAEAAIVRSSFQPAREEVFLRYPRLRAIGMEWRQCLSSVHAIPRSRSFLSIAKPKGLRYPRPAQYGGGARSAADLRRDDSQVRYLDELRGNPVLSLDALAIGTSYSSTRWTAHESAAVRLLRLSLISGKKRRVTVDADRQAIRSGVDLLDTISLPPFTSLRRRSR